MQCNSKPVQKNRKILFCLGGSMGRATLAHRTFQFLILMQFSAKIMPNNSPWEILDAPLAFEL